MSPGSGVCHGLSECCKSEVWVWGRVCAYYYLYLLPHTLLIRVVSFFLRNIFLNSLTVYLNFVKAWFALHFSCRLLYHLRVREMVFAHWRVFVLGACEAHVGCLCWRSGESRVRYRIPWNAHRACVSTADITSFHFFNEIKCFQVTSITNSNKCKWTMSLDKMKENSRYVLFTAGRPNTERYRQDRVRETEESVHAVMGLCVTWT